jgi:hypothetical protein
MRIIVYEKVVLMALRVDGGVCPDVSKKGTLDVIPGKTYRRLVL